MRRKSFAASGDAHLPTHVEENTIARGVLVGVTDTGVVLAIAGTDYRVHLKCANDHAMTAQTGKRVRGMIEANGLKLHKAQGGGRFIEPVNGMPRIVAGKVIAIDAGANRLCVDVSLPMWVTLVENGQRTEQFDIGDLVNCYVRSGATFRQVS